MLNNSNNKSFFLMQDQPFVTKNEIRLKEKHTNILRGFNEKLNLPIGGGKNGLALGSCLASPTLLRSAIALG